MRVEGVWRAVFARRKTRLKKVEKPVDRVAGVFVFSPPFWAILKRGDHPSNPPAARGKEGEGFLSFWRKVAERTTGDAHVAQSVERVLGKDEVTSSILVMGSRTGATERSEAKQRTTQENANG
jgi:hypothetical protein